jgi:DNA-binding XRE family transcriptional regulator
LPRELKTLGDHIRKKRIELGLLQREAANLLGADPQSVNAWERNYHQPSLRLLPAIIGFLNYNPDAITDEASLGRRIVVRRRELGISQQALAGCWGSTRELYADWNGIRRA